ncbi:MAG: alpha-mannosidase [Treponemataceae bacterium]|nr:MAG: alpha-mannosidase [Treponemataceae bacterium]
MLIAKVDGRISQYIRYLELNAYRKIASLEFEMFEADKDYRQPPEGVAWKKITTPAPWGKEWTRFWFRSTFTAPKTTRPLFLSVQPNADSLAFLDGKPYGAFNLFHKKLRIAGDGKKHTLHVESYSGHWHGGCGPMEGASIVVTIGKVLDKFPNTFDDAFLYERFENIYDLYYDAHALYEIAKQLDQNSLRKARILKELYDALMKISLTATGDDLEKQAKKARAEIAPLLKLKNAPTTPSVYMIGHAHIDHAWLWPIVETEHKVARTFMNMTRFAKEYPEFIFVQSQPCQLEFLKNEYPEIFAAVKQAFKNGNWEPNGGMWVEADCNLPSGESFIRQFLVGKKANREMFGGSYEADTLWLPDVFGYSAALPQILAGCRIKYFVTSKINWNDTTKFPYETFIWRGLDGTGVMTHFISSAGAGYNGRVEPQILSETWNYVQNKELQSAGIKSMGEGDGGGGTLRYDLEMARRLRDTEGVPKAAWKTVSASLKSIFAEKLKRELPEWRGELYLELHRGTYTSQARTKMYNRRMEFALRHLEWLGAVTSSYPREILLSAWKNVLTHQFHDVIPGSAIERVYEEAEAMYKKTLGEIEALSAERRQKLLASSGCSMLLFNDLSWQRSDIASCDAAKLSGITALISPNGKTTPVQVCKNIDDKKIALFSLASLQTSSFGWSALEKAESPKTVSSNAAPFVYKKDTLETPFYHITFDKAGRITSLITKANGRECVKSGGFFNAFVYAEDVPVFWSAWDIDADWRVKAHNVVALTSKEVSADGEVCFRLRQKYEIADSDTGGKGDDDLRSTLIQDMVFYAENARIDFETKVDWHANQHLLKVQFDTDIDAMRVRCEVQYGHLFRNTHSNLATDRAQFEICAHKWVCVESPDSGIALLNDSKYGHDVEGGSIRLSLLRSPVAPDPTADRGMQTFTYSLLPFQGKFEDSHVIHASYELNSPAVLEVSAGAAKKSDTAAAQNTAFSFCSITAADAAKSAADAKNGNESSVLLDVVKSPEDEKEGGKNAAKTYVVRLYESFGGKTSARLRFASPVVSAKLTDMLEGGGKKVAVAPNGTVKLYFHPFEIKTLLVELK